MNLSFSKEKLFLSFWIFLSTFIIYAQHKPWQNRGAVFIKPENTTIYNVLETRPALKNDGKTDNSILLQKLINNKTDYPSPAVFYFPPGTYIFNKPVYLKSGRILRGESPSKTFFISNSSSNIFLIFKSQGNNSRIYETKTSLSKASNYLIIREIQRLPKVDYLELYTPNDSLIIEKKWNRKWSQNLLGMIKQIDRIKGDTLFFTSSFNINTQKRHFFLKPIKTIKNVGFENFYLIAANPEMKGHNFLFINAANSWIDNVESEYTSKFHVSLVQSYKITIKNSFFHKSYNYKGGGHAYGVECGYHTTNSLIQNNIFDSLRHSMLVHLGANGNVFGYNYSIHPVWNEKGIPPDISVHGHYPYYNLFEGNEVEKISCTDYWGKAGPENTFYRNKINGQGIFINDADYTVIVGNKLIRPNAAIKISKARHVTNKHNMLHNEILNPISSILPPSLYLDKKPDFIKHSQWPLFDFKSKKSLLPAKKRYQKIKNKQRKNIFVKIWNWIKNIF